MKAKLASLAKTFSIAAAAIAVAWAIPFGMTLAGYRLYLNTTTSVPSGVYMVHVGEMPTERGGYVTFYPPEDAARLLYGRGWLAPGAPLTKQVAGLPGDIYCVNADGITVRGERLGPVYSHDRNGVALPRLDGCTAVPIAHILPLGLSAPNSFDGRYFGAVSDRLVVGKARLILTLPRG
ncbi:S26 family signal peptidase (plasmid) [Dyella sp. BiH032]|uniref:S26 family signal peptidase n=1 Tax=Dyella sp. BiH032 TaxID=3075430 RepID=UPI002892A596|nr:S26 family signal peptidase [Dyella sp. BiH032]WNL48575.1 S26 family signal peptidase [Dyella sp. BiH032]